MSNLLEDFKDAERVVKIVLQEDKQSRGNDRRLLIKVWEKQGLRLTEQQINVFMRVYPSETITRVRRKIQERGDLLPIKEIHEQRQLLSDEVRETIHDY